MDLKQVHTFLTVAETLNFTKAASQLSFAQSSVTSHIRALEDSLGKPLFDRLGKKIRLTEAGQDFLVYAERLVQLSEEAKLVISGQDEPEGTIVMGAQESLCTYRLPPILKEFKATYPKVKIVFKPAHSDTMVRQQLEEGKMDIAFFLDVLKPESALTMEVLAVDDIKLVASPEHALSGESNIPLQELKEETFLLTEAGCSYRNLFEKACREEGVHPGSQFEFGSVEAIKQCVMAGLGVALLPRMVVERELQSKELVELDVETMVPPVYTKMAWHKDKWKTAPLEACIELMRERLVDPARSL
ncbi:LysR family transcriptional regulator [Halobacillus litoralis]|uniref:LysR family transcriptional regulator n=1 Tax=Halobacillus litoralis TaxID=45668 RepID=UPI001CD4C82F|nr:LysR family transcriptional regulator [Halobacillus litoralis]MCA0969269.1 LysR family transcriptional regulator [Halobacillus litoralis]